MKVSIPQAVSAVATDITIVMTVNARDVSIPQAVSAVATISFVRLKPPRSVLSFNTASGKRCCNKLFLLLHHIFLS